MSKDLIGKHCLVYITPSKIEFRPEISVITGLHNVYPKTHVFLDHDYDSLYHVGGLLLSDDINNLEKLLEFQKEYLEGLNAIRNKIHNLKKEYSIAISKMVKEVK